MSFEPYIKPHGIGDLRFFYATPEAQAWYDPLKPYTKLEYEWVRENLDIEGQEIIDAGCHHGNYAVIFWGAAHLHCFDCVKNFLDITETNLRLNDYYSDAGDFFSLYHCRLSAGNGISLNLHPQAEPTICKVDIEGSEFELMPEEIDDFPSVHTWIVEIHPNAGDPNVIAQAFKDRQFELLKVDRERMVVRPYELGERWLTHATLIARKR